MKLLKNEIRNFLVSRGLLLLGSTFSATNKLDQTVLHFWINSDHPFNFNMCNNAVQLAVKNIAAIEIQEKPYVLASQVDVEESNTNAAIGASAVAAFALIMGAGFYKKRQSKTSSDEFPKV